MLRAFPLALSAYFLHSASPVLASADLVHVVRHLRHEAEAVPEP